MLINERADYPNPAQDEESREALLPKQDGNENALPGTPQQIAVLFCPLPGQVCYLKWWLMKFFADQVDVFHLYAEMGNDEHAEMWLEFQNS